MCGFYFSNQHPKFDYDFKDVLQRGIDDRVFIDKDYFAIQSVLPCVNDINFDLYENDNFLFLYTGEIYNYNRKFSCDTEMFFHDLVNGNSISHYNGMYAYVFYNKKTKEINKIQEENKTYLATIKVGESTPSYDRETEIDNIYPTSHINEELIMDSIKSFKGKSEQIPPVYSALKIDGKRSYELARKGEKIIPKKREIEIFKFNLLNFKNLEIDCEIECSKGTYIRSIASDMGKKLDSGAYLKYLERYSVGEYSIKNCLQIDEIKDLISLQ